MKELLTGKCETDFYNWFLLNNGLIDLSTKFYEEFLEYPLSMQWGVLVDFFDSENIMVYVTHLIVDDYKLYYSHCDVLNVELHHHLEEARTESVKKAVEIYNKR